MLYSHYYLSTAILDNLLKDICTCSYQEEFKKSLIDYLKKSTLVKSVFNLNYKSKTNSKTIEPTSYFYNLRLLYISDNKYKYEIIRWFEHSLIKFVSPSLIIASNGNIHQNKDVRTRLTKYIYIKDSTEFIGDRIHDSYSFFYGPSLIIVVEFKYTDTILLYFSRKTVEI